MQSLIKSFGKHDMRSFNCTKIQKHIDHHTYNTRSVVRIFIKSIPFKDDENDHITKNTPKKDYLRKKFKVKVESFVEMNTICSFKKNTNCHL